MGGPPIPGIGWAAGVERLAMMLEDTPTGPRPIAIIPVGADCEGPALELAERLRGAGTPIELGYRGNVSKRMKAANRARARAAILIGEDEIKRGAVTLRDLDSGEQAEVPLADLKDRLVQFQ